MRASTLLFGLFLATMASMFYCSWKSSRGIVSDFDPFRPRLFPRFGRRADYSAEGWRFRNRTLISQVLGIVLMILWGITKEAGH